MKVWSFVFAFSLWLQGAALDPKPLQNYVAVVIVDSTGLNTPGSVYFLAHGLDPCGLPCYLVPNTNSSDANYGLCEYVYPNTSGTPSSADPAISKSLSELPPATDTGQSDPAYLIYLPIDSSARGYLSIGLPMYLATQFNPAPDRQVLDINDASVTSIQDPNYYTWYQDFELGLVYNTSSVATGGNLTSQLFMNLSWVDYFSLPMKLEVYSNPSNMPITGIQTLISGFDPTISRDAILQAMQAGLKSADTSTTITTWSNLLVPYYQNQYTNATVEGYLRILAAKNSISLAESSQFQGPATNAAQTFFPSDYVHNSTYGPTATTTYMQEVYTYYVANTLTAQIFPNGGNNTTDYTYQISATSGDPNYTLTFTYTGASPGMGYPTPPPTITLALKTLTTEQLLSGSTWPFVPDSGTDVDFTNELSKLISALFTIGQLPLNTSQLTATPPTDYDCSGGFPTTSKIVNNSCGFSTLAPRTGQTNSYFHNPAPLNPAGTSFAAGPWYNVYDYYLHSNQLVTSGDVPNNPSFGLGYGYDYDDLLNMAGLVNPLIQDQYGNPQYNGDPSLPNAYVVVTLGNLVGTPVLNINNDTYTTNPNPPVPYQSYQKIPYAIALGALSADSAMVVNFLWFDGTNQNTTPAPSSGTTTLADIVADPNHLFQVEFMYNGVTYTYNINLLRQVVTLVSPSSPYSSVDQSLINGITFSFDSTTGVITINIASVAPAWPG